MPMTLDMINNLMYDCTLCPRRCHVDRLAGQVGFCGQTAELKAARAALHYWEEPCISGAETSGASGSGAVFFSGCSLQCVFCQNHNISVGKAGRLISVERLAEIFLELQEKGAANINLVTGTHFIPHIAYALQTAKAKGLSIPIVYNTGSYEKTSSLRLLEGLIDIYLPDLKYVSSELSAKYSHADDYFDIASAAISEMYRQVGSPIIDANTELMRRGIIVRHLLLPEETKDSKKVLRYLYETYKNDIYVSIMNQYTPLEHTAQFPPLNRSVTEMEYKRVLTFAERLGIRKGFYQEGGTAGESFIPEFDGEGL